jgi:iron(III) transport system ATP-binding protein
MLHIKGLTKRFAKSRLAAVNDFSLSVECGEIVALLGQSGCGKTTVLRMIAGFETPTEGEIWLKGKLVCGKQVFIEPESRGVGIVFQDYALFPHMTVLENITFGLFRIPKREQHEKAASIMELTGLTGLEKRYPHEISGGQKQRVALARAMAPKPGIILFDEPFSNIDTTLRKRMRYEIKEIIQKAHLTAIFVTHDTRDAMILADKVIIMNDGQTVQSGPPLDVALNPANEYISGLFEGCC